MQAWSEKIVEDSAKVYNISQFHSHQLWPAAKSGDGTSHQKAWLVDREVGTSVVKKNSGEG